VLVGGCADEPDTFAEAVCPATLEWRERMSERVEDFAHTSRTLAAADDRRALYLALYGSIERSVEGWVRDLEDAPAPAKPGSRRVLLDEAQVFLDALAEDEVESEALPLSAFERRAVADGDLLKEIEKAQARTRARMVDLGVAGEPGIDANCGRTAVVGDPSRRL
jgi:hypothetical protein